MGAGTSLLFAGFVLYLFSVFPSDMMPTVNVPFFDVKVGSSANEAQEVELRNRVTSLDPVKRAPALALHLDPVVRGVCIAVGNDRL